MPARRDAYERARGAADQSRDVLVVHTLKLSASLRVWQRPRGWSALDPRGCMRHDPSVKDRPYFIWDLDVSEADLRERLRARDPQIRAQWQARVMREARFADVWRYVSLDEVVRDWSWIRRHLGRSRAFWEFLLDGWRARGLLAS